MRLLQPLIHLTMGKMAVYLFGSGEAQTHKRCEPSVSGKRKPLQLSVWVVATTSDGSWAGSGVLRRK